MRPALQPATLSIYTQKSTSVKQHICPHPGDCHISEMASHGVARTTRARTQEQKQQELDKIAKYRDLEAQVRKHSESSSYSSEAFQLTTKLLRLNPEYYTIWNVRRRFLISGLLSRPSAGSLPSKGLPSSSQTATTTTSSADSSSSLSTTTPPNPESPTTGKNGITADVATDTKSQNQENDLDVLRSELGFTVPLLMEFPKCYWIWKYRSWLLQQAIERLDTSVARRIWEEELGLDTKMLTKDRRNFHAWGYRRNVIQHLESATLNGTSMVESEFAFTTKMIHADLSNFSAWHNRSKLIPRVLMERQADDAARKKFFDNELAIIRDALNVGPDDQSLWYYHQFLVLDLTEHANRPSITAGLSIDDRTAYLSEELAFIRDLLEDYDDCKLIYEKLMEYTLALVAIEQRELREDEKLDLQSWLNKARELDPMRKGRWGDVERDFQLAQ
ncbi:hypothetical protein BD289DRAFT_426151 [Coniella lustricola]|uniref:Geranylgeranyl transferase type-2 subunit alpha n=1 Tax=Coniella lustricola TaxID=2025994 RepID=A0A2T3AGN2_9PEZI|nr:hypothetical protein BD289DRAFT_426151 [Coniella lustricola]